MKYVSKKMYDKAHIIVPHIRNHYKEIMIIATISQILLITVALISFYYIFYFSQYMVIPAILPFLYFIHVSINKNNVKDIKKEILRQEKCKNLSKKR